MARLFWNSDGVRGAELPPFEPQTYADVLHRLGEAVGVEFSVCAEHDRSGGDASFAPIRSGGRRCGWGVVCAQAGEREVAAATLAADLLGRLFTADQDITSLAQEVTDRYEELNFLYNMGNHVAGLLDEEEICKFAVEEAAWLMNCDRASVMVPDPEDGLLRVRAAVGLPEEIRAKVRVTPGEGISGKVFESGRGITVNEGDPMPAESLKTRGLRDSNCFLSVPLKITGDGETGESVVGVFNLTRKRGGDMFTASDLKLVSAVAATVATQIHNCRLLSAERERQRLEHELELAARIQLSLLPKKPLIAGPLHAGGHCKPARRVGGDLFDYWMQGDQLCMVVADVSGHDVGAALMATSLRSVMRSETAHRQSVAGLMSQVNRALFADLCNAELFISAFYAEVDVKTGRMDYCRAGHPMPLLVRGSERRWLDTEGMLFGIREDGGFAEDSVLLQEGDSVVCYTDGLMESGEDREHFFGRDGVRDAALRMLDRQPKELALGIIGAACEHAGAAGGDDDMTVMVLRMDGYGGS